MNTYSGGMKRRLNLASALVHDPELVLLDEPTVGVDPQSRNQIFENILALKQQGRTLIYTTHYMEEAERLCDRVAIVDKGRLLALGTVPELMATHGGRATLVAQTDRGEVRARDRRSARRAQSARRRRHGRVISHGAGHARTGVPAPDGAQPEGLMRSILALATKDLRLLVRVKSGLFFTFVWPVIVAVLFGFVFSGQSQTTRALRVAVVDEDNTDGSRAFVATLESSGDFAVDRAARADAESLVRRAQRAAFIVLKPGFGAASERMFYGEPRQIEIGIDPARARRKRR